MPRFKLNFMDRIPTRVQEMEFETAKLGDALDIASNAEGYSQVELQQDGRTIGRLVKCGSERRPFWLLE